MTLPALTGNDLARAEAALATLITFWQHSKHRRSKFVRDEIARSRAVIGKLARILDTAYPDLVEDAPQNGGVGRVMGADRLYRPDRKAIAAARRRTRAGRRKAQ